MNSRFTLLLLVASLIGTTFGLIGFEFETNIMRQGVPLKFWKAAVCIEKKVNGVSLWEMQQDLYSFPLTFDIEFVTRAFALQQNFGGPNGKDHMWWTLHNLKQFGNNLFTALANSGDHTVEVGSWGRKWTVHHGGGERGAVPQSTFAVPLNVWYNAMRQLRNDNNWGGLQHGRKWPFFGSLADSDWWNGNHFVPNGINSDNVRAVILMLAQLRCVGNQAGLVFSGWPDNLEQPLDLNLEFFEANRKSLLVHESVKAGTSMMPRTALVQILSLLSNDERARLRAADGTGAPLLERLIDALVNTVNSCRNDNSQVGLFQAGLSNHVFRYGYKLEFGSVVHQGPTMREWITNLLLADNPSDLLKSWWSTVGAIDELDPNNEVRFELRSLNQMTFDRSIDLCWTWYNWIEQATRAVQAWPNNLIGIDSAPPAHPPAGVNEPPMAFLEVQEQVHRNKQQSLRFRRRNAIQTQKKELDFSSETFSKTVRDPYDLEAVPATTLVKGCDASKHPECKPDSPEFKKALEKAIPPASNALDTPFQKTFVMKKKKF